MRVSICRGTVYYIMSSNIRCIFFFLKILIWKCLIFYIVHSVHSTAFNSTSRGKNNSKTFQLKKIKLYHEYFQKVIHVVVPRYYITSVVLSYEWWKSYASSTGVTWSTFYFLEQSKYNYNIIRSSSPQIVCQ